MNRRKFLSLLGLGSTFPWLARALPLATATPTAIAIPSASPWTIDDAAPGTKISLIACGGAGIAMTRHLNKGDYGLHEIIAIDSSLRALQSATNADKRLLISRTNAKKPSMPAEAWLCADQNRDALVEAVGRPHLFIIVLGQGGAIGGGMGSYLANVVRKYGTVVAFTTLPYKFESNARHRNAQIGSATMAHYCDNVCSYSHANMAIAMPADIGFETSIDLARSALEQYLWNTAGCLTRQGLVGMDFEDVRTVLSKPDFLERPLSSCIGWGEASGAERAAIAARDAWNHHALRSSDGGQVIGMSVSIRAAQRNLKMKEVNSVMNDLKAYLGNSDSHIIFSADYDDTLGDRLQVSVILNRIEA